MTGTDNPSKLDFERLRQENDEIETLAMLIRDMSPESHDEPTSTFTKLAIRQLYG